MSYIKRPQDIEIRSFEIIEEEMGEKAKEFLAEHLPVVKRVIHTTADFEYADLLEFSDDAIESCINALKNGGKIYCDTQMIANGLSKPNLTKFGYTAYSLVSDPEVAKEAKERGITRSIVGMEKASKDADTNIFLIGNAPTALFRLKELIDSGEVSKPALIVGVPVGFVGAAESKEILPGSGIPYIIVKGRKGGSPVAVSILHGILYQIYKREGF
ncbi:MAG: precorrin-8X methylmutase [Cetobacterium sp.]|uniref:precorrin-8X methylmutase n=1 Tax=Cetobacterium sp. TaxID=2071632 RepID=UPI002FCB824F